MDVVSILNQMKEQLDKVAPSLVVPMNEATFSSSTVDIVILEQGTVPPKTLPFDWRRNMAGQVNMAWTLLKAQAIFDTTIAQIDESLVHKVVEQLSKGLVQSAVAEQDLVYKKIGFTPGYILLFLEKGVEDWKIDVVKYATSAGLVATRKIMLLAFPEGSLPKEEEMGFRKIGVGGKVLEAGEIEDVKDDGKIIASVKVKDGKPVEKDKKHSVK